ncbi:threonylcarbamoyladenosine tRNA methylthiotransferase MtaB [Holospora obtusa F1]|uniref:Threonylcarbamoyladenosine tRNA methylthiotransferase MtaB n=1 Tax=Holospora obtusa F1 TaxID=1399147 RepID=W6TE86_HOLOB|nr:tRNA (N(6)-L-threonylcarbamoyladenosine(37)-C(2))-methylthiotransferase MtaB [Holospora obtusa]ETZ07241.1 threonylcarbamoyladenosine tRNA methylthiotransferase MtaB [Holospora obtusa F1]
MEEKTKENKIKCKDNFGVQTVTLGCRLNIHESHVMEDLAIQEGLKNTIIVNTCAVTKEAERQSHQALRSARANHPEAYIIATGCAVQLNPESFSLMPEINRIIGNDGKLKKESFSKDFPYRVSVGPLERKIQENFPILNHFKGKIRAFLQVQNGCNHRCAFCNIPKARGPSRSVPLGWIVQQIRALCQAGVQEVVFTGVDLTSYGKDLPGNVSLGRMIKRVLMQVPELKRLRLSSLDSIEIDEALFEVLAYDHRMLPHLHLSFQSGSSYILNRMLRRHTREDALDFCDRIRKVRPEINLTSDFIVGFPGETEHMFEETVSFVKETRLGMCHIFPFSPRPGTLATKLDGHLQKSEIKERAKCLRQENQLFFQEILQKKIDTVQSVLIEEGSFGYSSDFIRVTLDPDPGVRQSIQNIRITQCTAKGWKGMLN